MITFHDHPSPTIRGLWAVVRSGPHTPPTLETDGITTQGEAKAEARRLAKQREVMLRKTQSAEFDPYTSRIPRGFYTDKDAS